MGQAREQIKHRSKIKELLDARKDEIAELKIEKALAEKRRTLARKMLGLPPTTITRSCTATWHKCDDSDIPHKKQGLPDGQYLIVSEYPDMPKVLDALGELPHSGSPMDILVLDPELFELVPKCHEIYDELVDAESIVLLDAETGSGAPVKCEEGTVEKVYGHFYDYLTADIRYFGDKNIDEEVAWSYLKQQLVFACRKTYADLVPVKRGNKQKKKSYKMNAVGRCCEFAELLMCGKFDYSEFKKRPAKEKERARALINVEIPKEAYPSSLHAAYDKIHMLKDIGKLWESAASHDSKVFDFSYADIDEGHAKEIIESIGEKIGIESFIEAWEAGVPVEDIVA